MSELERRFVHLSGTGLPLLYLLDLVTWRTLTWLLVAGTLVAVVLETLRLFVGLEWRVYDRLTREYERDNPAGYALYMVSLTAVVLVFAPNVAIPGMLMLTIGDPVSGVLATRGVTRGKSLPVLAAMFGVCFVLALPFVTALPVSLPVGVAASAAGALGATVADGVKPIVRGYVVDDNLSIPPAACVAIWLVVWLAG